MMLEGWIFRVFINQEGRWSVSVQAAGLELECFALAGGN